MSTRTPTVNDVSTWLTQWFARRGSIVGERATDYLALGAIDSLGLLELIADVEAHFAIRFQERDLQDPSFATIDGLAMIVARRAS